MKYNTQLSLLRQPEYGRHVHNMVDYCMTLETKEERTQCAHSIIDIMGNMFPHLRDVSDFKHILWDHLAIMSDFQLDIDYPYEIIKKEDLYSKPARIAYSRPNMRYRHYGKILDKMIKIACEMEDEEERRQFSIITAMHMKKSHTQWNREVEDAKILADMYDMSDGKLDLRQTNFRLPDIREREQTNQRNNGGGGAGGGRRRRR